LDKNPTFAGWKWMYFPNLKDEIGFTRQTSMSSPTWLKRNEKVGPRIRISSHDLLVFTNRGTSGKDYNALCEAIDLC
jgi:hypothetical protein